MRDRSFLGFRLEASRDSGRGAWPNQKVNTAGHNDGIYSCGRRGGGWLADLIEYSGSVASEDASARGACTAEVSLWTAAISADAENVEIEIDGAVTTVTMCSVWAGWKYRSPW